MGSLQAAKDIYVELQSLKSSQAYARGQGGLYCPQSMALVYMLMRLT